MELNLNSRIDRFMNRELHPEAARALAHQALEDSELFEELTAVALAQAALESPATDDRKLAQSALDDEDLFDTLVARGALGATTKAPNVRKHRTMGWAGVAAVAAGLLTFFVLRPHPTTVQAPPHVAISKPAVAPTILLTSALQPAPSAKAPVFRGINVTSRAPKSDGTILSIEDRVATVNLGAIDGLAKGSELLGGRIVISTVFRDRARARIVGEGIQVNDAIRVPASLHLRAVLQQVDALAAKGDLKTAREVARNAIASGSPGETRQLLQRLAALDYQAGAPDAAREHYEVAVNNFDQPPAASATEQAMTLASYGALLLMKGDRARADELLQKALAKSTDPALRSQILNNLGAVAELSDDTGKAAGYYRRALEQKAAMAEREIVAANLARVEKAK